MAIDWSPYATSTPQEDGILSAIGVTAKRTGSRLLDILMNLDRPRRALWLGVEASLGEEDILKAMKKGWSLEDDLRTMDFFSEEFKEEHKILAPVAGFVGDVLGDPLTYVGAGAARQIGRGISKVTPGVVKNLAENLGRTDIARGLGVYRGDVRVAKEAADTARLRAAGQRSVIEQEVKQLRKEIDRMAGAAGVSYDDAARAFAETIENPPKITEGPWWRREGDAMRIRMTEELEASGGKFNQELFDLAKRHKLQYEDFLELEKRAGVKITDIMSNSRDLGVQSYLPHILGPKGRSALSGSKSFADWFRSPAQHASALPRNIKGTIKSINAEYAKKLEGQQLLHLDPALLMGVRKGRHITGMAGAQYLKDVAKALGHQKQLIYDPKSKKTVSYTHLTLPTIYSV